MHTLPLGPLAKLARNALGLLIAASASPASAQAMSAWNRATCR